MPLPACALVDVRGAPLIKLAPATEDHDEVGARFAEGRSISKI